MKAKLEQKAEPRKGRGISVDKYDRIIDVAYVMFPAKGFSATKMEDIAKKQGFQNKPFSTGLKRKINYFVK